MSTWEWVKRAHGIALLRRKEDGKMTVVAHSANNSQVYSYMPGDKPKGGGQWMAHANNEGIDYVANGYSPSYARRVFREAIAEEERIGGAGN